MIFPLIANPLAGSRMLHLFSAHSPRKERIARLEKMACGGVPRSRLECERSGCGRRISCKTGAFLVAEKDGLC